MKELEKILDEITNVSNEDIKDDYKRYIIKNLWDLYYSKKDNFIASEDDEIYIIDEKPEINEIDDIKLFSAIENLKINGKVNEEESKIILEWVVSNARKIISKLGVNIKKNSLDGYCELAQLITIYPLEQIGLKVTKNTAQNTFSYPLNHAFGTVTFNVSENGENYIRSYLIDITYRQFFKKEKCNKGRYYVYNKPDVGFFVEDVDFARNLMKKGYIEMNAATSKIYGEAFYRTGLEMDDKVNKEINYFQNILNSKEDYVLTKDNLEGLDINIPKI